MRAGPLRPRPRTPASIGHRTFAPARLPRRVPELRRAGRVPLGGGAVRDLQLLPLGGGSRRRPASKDRPERRAVRRPHAPPARRLGQVPRRGVHARRPAPVPLRRRHLERMARALRERAGPAEIGLALGRQRPLRHRLRRAADDAGAGGRETAAGRAAQRQRAKLDRRLGRRGQADRGPGRAAAAAESRARLRRRRRALEPRRGRHHRLHRSGAAGAGRSAARWRSPSSPSRACAKRARRRSAAAPCNARTAAPRSTSSWRRRSRSSARSASR